MTVLALAPSLDTAAAAPLHGELLARLDARQPILLDGAGVVRAGQACLQLLASARAAAGEQGLAYSVANPSPALIDMTELACLGAVLEPLG